MRRSIYDEDHEAFRSSVREFLDREVVPHLEEHAGAHGLSREFWLAAGKQGFLGLEIPEEYGGSEAGDYRFNAVLTEELAKVNMTLPSCVGIHADIVAPYLVHLTNEEQKQRWLPGFCTGELVTAIGMTEPGGGSDPAELAFENVRVSDADLIGPLDTGFISMMQFLPQERLGSAITNLAHARQILDETIQYAKDRKAFGQSIGSFQNTQFLLADLVTRVEVTQAYVDQCVIAHTKQELTPVDAAKAKWWSSQVQNDVLDHCVQVHGGYGYMNEYRVARAWRDARVTKIWAGSNEIMKLLIGRDLGL